MFYVLFHHFDSLLSWKMAQRHVQENEEEECQGPFTPHSLRCGVARIRSGVNRPLEQCATERILLGRYNNNNYYYYCYDLFASANAYAINQHINVVCCQKMTTVRTRSLTNNISTHD